MNIIQESCPRKSGSAVLGAQEGNGLERINTSTYCNNDCVSLLPSVIKRILLIMLIESITPTPPHPVLVVCLFYYLSSETAEQRSDSGNVQKTKKQLDTRGFLHGFERRLPYGLCHGGPRPHTEAIWQVRLALENA